MLAALEQRVINVGALNSKLILLVGSGRSGKSRLLHDLGKKSNIEPVNVGRELGHRLATKPSNKRSFQASELLREIADKRGTKALLLLDNLELLFDRALQLDPLDLLKRNSHAKPVVAVWPGDLINNRLTYAELGHPEHQDYNIEGVVLFDVQ